MIDKKIRKYIKEIRISSGMTKAEFSRETKLPSAYIWQLENGKRPYTLKTLKKISKVLGRPVWEIIKVAEVLK